MRPIEKVFIDGWSTGLLAIAFKHLVVADTNEVDPEEASLTRELLRCLQWGVRNKPSYLNKLLRRLRSHGREVSLWDRLLDENDQPPVISELLRAYPHAATLIVDRLDRARRGILHWRQLRPSHQKYIKALLAIGTDECFDYLANNVHLRLSEDRNDIIELVGPHVLGLTGAVKRLWNSLRWDRPITIMFLFRDAQAPATELVSLVLDTDPMTLVTVDRLSYVTLLGESADPRGSRISSTCSAPRLHLQNRQLAAWTCYASARST